MRKIILTTATIATVAVASLAVSATSASAKWCTVVKYPWGYSVVCT